MAPNLPTRWAALRNRHFWPRDRLSPWFAGRRKQGEAFRSQLDDHVSCPQRWHTARGLFRIGASRQHAGFIPIHEKQVEMRQAALDVFEPAALRVPAGVERRGKSRLA